jgi:hypothetical protein
VFSGTFTVPAFPKHSTDASTGFFIRQTNVPIFIPIKAVASGWSTPTRQPTHSLLNVPVSYTRLAKSSEYVNSLLLSFSNCSTPRCAVAPTPPSHACFGLACHMHTSYFIYTYILYSGPRRCHLFSRHVVSRDHQLRSVHSLCVHVYDGTQFPSQR